MVQIVRRKKKGRPSKADLARRMAGESPAKKPEVRRSHRRRNPRFGVIDYGDYIDDDEEFDLDEFCSDGGDAEEENRTARREKKLKLVVKLSGGGEEPATRRGGARGGHAPAETEDEEESDGERNRKKRRISGGDDGEDDEDEAEERDENVCGEDEEDDDDEERSARKVDSKRLDSVPGTPTEARARIPLPEKKTLELILDKLQKKDTYGVYADPVDPEELPDYHDVIEHPMDFATVRKRLADGLYSTLDQLESDIFLICSNAMQYNSPETIYHRQARAIQELGKKKFEKLRVKFERAQREMKVAQKTKSNSIVNKFESSEEETKLAQKIKSNSMVKKHHMRKPLYRTSQETLGSDFSSGATLATAGEILNSMSLTPVAGCDNPSNNDLPAEVLNENNLDKAEETSSAKGFLSKLGRKPMNLEDNRRGTYNISTQPVIKPESVFTTFESEIKQLVAVGLQAEYAYARSLARFAATLGPVAWKVASQRIEQALPDGYKFGRGWVGEYEPLPTPVLMLENRNLKQSGLIMENNSFGKIKKNEKARGPQLEVKPSPPPSSAVPHSEVKPSVFNSARPRSEPKPSAFSSTARKSCNPTVVNAVQSAQPRNVPKHDINSPRQVELNDLPTPNHKKPNNGGENPFSRNPEAAASKLREALLRPANLPNAMPFKMPESNGVGSAALPNGKDSRNSHDNQTFFPHGQNLGSNDPAKLMKDLAEKSQKQQRPPDQPTVESNNAAATAARAWMSIGAGPFVRQPAENLTNPHPPPPKTQISADSLYNPARESQPQITRIRSEFPVPGAVHQFHPAFFNQHVAAHFQNRPVMMFPQLAAADLARFQMQSPWQGLSPHAAQPPRQRQDMLPPDLNIGFQSPQSPPVKPSSGVMVESQQPDLALQL